VRVSDGVAEAQGRRSRGAVYEREARARVDVSGVDGVRARQLVVDRADRRIGVDPELRLQGDDRILRVVVVGVDVDLAVAELEEGRIGVQAGREVDRRTRREDESEDHQEGEGDLLHGVSFTGAGSRASRRWIRPATSLYGRPER